MTPIRDTVDARSRDDGCRHVPRKVPSQHMTRSDDHEIEKPSTSDGSRTRIWTALIVGLAAVPTVAFVALSLGFADPGDVAETPSSPGSTLLFILCSQTALFLLATVPAALSRQPFHVRLGLVRPSSSVLHVVVLMVGTIFVMLASGIGIELIFEDAASPLQDSFVAVGAATGTIFIAIFLASATLPAFAEEMLFRGYVQRRLLDRWPAWLAIGVSSSLFAIMHVHPIHAIGVFPIGIWFGIIAWRSKSIWPSIACHFAANAFWVVLAGYWNAIPEEWISLVYWTLFLTTFLAFAWGVVILFRSATDRRMF